MNWWERNIVPKLICACCGQPEIMARRALVVPLAAGDVFELGCGGGINIALYDPAKITRFAGLDPSPKLLDKAREAANEKGLSAAIDIGVGEAIPHPDASFDTVVCTYTLCSVSQSEQAVREMRRILRPGGKLLFLEHGKSPDEGPAKWQRRIEPIWKRIGGNCHLTRPITKAYEAAGFAIEERGQGYAEKAPRAFGWMEWGVARKAGT